MIGINKDGRPFTNEDIQLMTAYNESEVKLVVEWIKNNIIPRKTPYRDRSSYRLKHLLEEETGLYTTNNQFKDAMLMCGFQPVNETAINWIFCFSAKSPCIRRFKSRNNML